MTGSVSVRTFSVVYGGAFGAPQTKDPIAATIRISNENEFSLLIETDKLDPVVVTLKTGQYKAEFDDSSNKKGDNDYFSSPQQFEIKEDQSISIELEKGYAAP